MSHHYLPLLAGFAGGTATLAVFKMRGRRPFAVLWGDILDIYHDEDKHARNITFALLGGLWAMYLFLALTAAHIAERFIPIEQHVTQTVEKVVKIKQVFVPVPSDVKYPSLDDPKKACHGAPVFIVGLDVAGAQGQSKDDESVNTWMTVRPAGDPYTVACFMPGDYSSHWHVGDLISMPAGKVSSEDDK